MNDPKEYAFDLQSLINISNMSDYQMTESEVDQFLDKLIDCYHNGGSVELELGTSSESGESIKLVRKASGGSIG